MVQEITLTLHELTEAEDGVARLDQADMRHLGVLPGDLLSLEGERTVFVRALPAYLEDRNQEIVRVSPLVRQNLRLEKGKQVRIAPVRQRPEIAEEVEIEVQDELDFVFVTAKLKLLSTYWHDRFISPNDKLSIPSLDKEPVLIEIKSVRPSGLVRITNESVFIPKIRPQDRMGQGKPLALGGLRDLYKTCERLASRHLLAHAPQSAKSILLRGPSGCGKARLVRRLAQSMELGLTVLDMGDLLQKQLSASQTDSVFALSDLGKRGPSILLLDHLEEIQIFNLDPPSVVQAKVNLAGFVSTISDEVALYPNLQLFATLGGTQEIANLKCERFDIVIPVDAPDKQARQEILLLETEGMELDPEIDLDAVAAMTQGCTGRDLHRLTLSASLESTGATLTNHDFSNALRHIEPSINAEVFCDVPSVLWNDLAGLEDIKTLLRETLEWSLRHNAKFASLGVNPPRSILLSGGQGTGKTSLARALANVTPTHFIEMSCPLLVANDLKTARRLLHDSFALARRKTPCLIFLDDLDALFESSRGDEESETAHPLIALLLEELDKLAVTPGIVVLAATNRPDRLTSEIMRAGRLDYAITLPMPDLMARKKILQIHARKLPLSADVDFDHLATLTQTFSPADIANLCNRAGLIALRQSINSQDGGVIPPVVTAAVFEQILRGKKA